MQGSNNSSLHNQYSIRSSHVFPMKQLHSIFGVLLFFFLLSVKLPAVTLVAYNVENLFDLDGVAGYEDYSSDKYTPRHLLMKVGNIAKVLSKVDSGRGPDILILNEIEVDQTPQIGDVKASEWLDSVKNTTIEEILSASPLPPEIASLPAEIWLQKALEDAGLGRYHMASSEEGLGNHEDGRLRSVKNLILSRFPIISVRIHPTLNARSILEAQLDINGRLLTVFANHWKSGAGSPDNERVRVVNARTLRDRLDAIFKQDPLADVIIAGDLNSHYNQSLRYPNFKKSGINDVLGSQGNESALASGEADLYNLWFELPFDKRGSDVFQNGWGTLMHIIVSKGLYDTKNLQYNDNSFEVLAIPGLNADALGRPLRWSKGSEPSGFSDHFPILARFREADSNTQPAWMPLSNPSTPDPVDFDPVRKVSTGDVLSNAVDPSKEPPDTDFRKPEWMGKIFLINAPGTVGKRGVVTVELNGITYPTYSPDTETRDRLRKMARSGSMLHFYAQLNTFKEEWQFFLPKGDWIIEDNGDRN